MLRDPCCSNGGRDVIGRHFRPVVKQHGMLTVDVTVVMCSTVDDTRVQYFMGVPEQYAMWTGHHSGPFSPIKQSFVTYGKR
jgi:hypothetical protein